MQVVPKGLEKQEYEDKDKHLLASVKHFFQ